MKITADTTDEEILAPIAQFRGYLAKAVEQASESDIMCGEILVEKAQAVHRAEVLASIGFRYREVLRAVGEDKTIITSWIITTMETHARQGEQFAVTFLSKLASDLRWK